MLSLVIIYNLMFLYRKMHCQTIQELEDHFGCKLESLATCMDLAAVGKSYFVTSTVVHPFHSRFQFVLNVIFPPLYPKTKQCFSWCYSKIYSTNGHWNMGEKTGLFSIKLYTSRKGQFKGKRDYKECIFSEIAMHNESIGLSIFWRNKIETAI